MLSLLLTLMLQDGPPTQAVYVVTNVPMLQIGVPKISPRQRVTRSVENCNIKTSDHDHVCLSVWIVEPISNEGLGGAWLRVQGDGPHQASAAGLVSLRVRKKSVIRLTVDTPPGYGRRPE